MKPSGVFETMLSNKGRIFALNQHLSRLRKGCSILGISFPKEIRKKLNTELGRCGYKHARIRLDVYKTIYGNEFSISIKNVPKIKRLPYSVLFLKSRSVKPGIYSALKIREREFYETYFNKAKKLGYQEAIFCNTSGEVVEGTRTNIFIVKDGKAYTPYLKSGCLDGITRRIVLRILKKIGIKVFKTAVFESDIFSADEIFLTNSIIGVVPVFSINGIKVGRFRNKPVFKKTAAFYTSLVEKGYFLG